MSVSRWIAEQVTQRLSYPLPTEVPEAFGAFPDFPEVSALRSGYGKDVHREPIERCEARIGSKCNDPGPRVIWRMA